MALIVCLLTGCSDTAKWTADKFPKQAGFNYRLESTGSLSASSAPDLVRSMNVKHALYAIYAGPKITEEKIGKPEESGIKSYQPKVRVSAYEMPSGATAFELAQKWRPQDDAVACHKDEVFFVVKAEADASKVTNETLRHFCDAFR